VHARDLERRLRGSGAEFENPGGSGMPDPGHAVGKIGESDEKIGAYICARIALSVELGLNAAEAFASSGW
jgi:hypothetical protein